MVNLTFLGQSTPDIRGKLQHLDRALAMSPSQLMDIVFKVYHAQEARKLKQATVFLKTCGEARRRGGTCKKGEDPLGINQCTCCKEEGHWRKDCLELKKKKKKKKG